MQTVQFETIRSLGKKPVFKGSRKRRKNLKENRKGRGGRALREEDSEISRAGAFRKTSLVEKVVKCDWWWACRMCELSTGRGGGGGGGEIASLL